MQIILICTIMANRLLVIKEWGWLLNKQKEIITDTGVLASIQGFRVNHTLSGLAAKDYYIMRTVFNTL
jgi:hypothetical protein